MLFLNRIGIKEALNNSPHSSASSTVWVGFSIFWSELSHFLHYSSHFSFSGRNLAVSVIYPSASQQKISKTKQRKHLSGIFDQPLVAGLAVHEQILHDMKGMLDLGVNAGFRMFKLLHQFAYCCFRQCLALGRAHCNMPGTGNSRLPSRFSTPW